MLIQFVSHKRYSTWMRFYSIFRSCKKRERNLSGWVSVCVCVLMTQNVSQDKLPLLKTVSRAHKSHFPANLCLLHILEYDETISTKSEHCKLMGKMLCFCATALKQPAPPRTVQEASKTNLFTISNSHHQFATYFHFSYLLWLPYLPQFNGLALLPRHFLIQNLL